MSGGFQSCFCENAQTLFGSIDRLAEMSIAALERQFDSRLSGDYAWLKRELRSQIETVLRFAAEGDATLLALRLAEAGVRCRNLGIPLEHAVASGPIFVESCLKVLGEEGRISEELRTAFVAMTRIDHRRQDELLKAYCSAESRRNPKTAESAGWQGGVKRSSKGERDHLCGLVGSSAPMQEIYSEIEDCSRSRETVFVVGESGTGKELVARAIHLCSGDPPERWVPVNCASMQPQMMVALLSGHRKGAFTGALESRIGLVRSAEGGTLYLDEITEMTAESQAALLRVIQEHSVLPIGESREIPVKVRIVASTNQLPERSMGEGKLRRDLYYRLQRLVVEVPPLRNHLEDVPQLVCSFTEKWRVANRTEKCPMFSASAMTRLLQHDWQGNVRELENVVFAACSFAGKSVIEAQDIEARLSKLEELSDLTVGAPIGLREAERVTIIRALQITSGNKSQAARLLGLSRKQLYVKLKRYHLSEP